MSVIKQLTWAVALTALPAAVSASAVIDNGTIALGVDDYGQLNITNAAGIGVGVTDLRTGHESTYPGCLCEGWGVGIGETGESGYANNAAGISGLSLVGFTSDATTATSITEMGTSLRITHHFTPAAETDDLYRVSVTIENISGSDISDLRYTRLMDWDIEPTAFSEYVTIGGTAAASAVLYANNDGFQSGDPFGIRSPIVSGAVGDFVDLGPADHGALFDFGFGQLLAGESQEFDIFYGASLSESGAFNALNAVEAEVYSLGQSINDKNGGTPGYSTFIFGFSGVGGDVVPPDTGVSPIPLPASAYLLLGGLGLIGALRTRRRKAI